MASEKHLHQAQRHLPTTAPPWIPIGRLHRANPSGEPEPCGGQEGDKSWVTGSSRIGSPSVVIGSSRRRVVPVSGGLSRRIRPPSASTRSLRPSNPVPPARVA